MKIAVPLKLFALSLGLTFLSGTALAGGGPTISISASPTVLTDQGEDTFFTIAASSPATRSIAINFTLRGTAFPNISYTIAGNIKNGRIVLKPGESSATVQLHTFDVDGPPFTTAGITILGGERYRVGAPNTALVTIQNVR